MGQLRMTCMDIIVLLSILYGFTDLIASWKIYASCKLPIKEWLLMSYLMALSFRVIQLLAQFSSFNDLTERVTRYRHCMSSTLRVRIINCSTGALIGFCFPLFLAWTILGAYWYRSLTEGPMLCLSKFEDAWFIMFWLIICFTWILCYVILLVLLLLSKLSSMKFKEQALYQIRKHPRGFDLLAQAITQQVRRRQEVLNTITEYGLVFCSGGLSRQLIVIIPSENFSLPLHDLGFWHCVICLQKFAMNESVKRLPVCGHVFHQECADLFLLLDSRCLFCFHNVRASQMFDNFLRSPPSLAASDSLGDAPSSR